MSDNLGTQFDEKLFTEKLKAWANKLYAESPSNVWTSSVSRTTPDYDVSTLWGSLYTNRMILPDLAHDGQFWGIPSTRPRSMAEMYEVSPEEIRPLRPLNVPKIKETLEQRNVGTESWESKELDEFLDEFKKNGGDSA